MTSSPDPNRPAGPPDDLVPVPPALRRRLQECFEHAQKLMRQDSYDFNYAHAMLVECVAHDPGNIVYLDAFFENLHRKYNNNKRGARLNFGGRGAFKKAISKQEWQQVLKAGLDLLRSNPWDVTVLRGMAEACASFGLHETELRYLKNALAVKPKDADVNRHCAVSLSRLGQFDQAIACWQRVDEAQDGDREAQQAISELQVEKTHVQKGKPPGESSKTAAVPKSTSSSEEPAPPPRREVELTRRQQLEQAIAVNPVDLHGYFELADLHVSEGRLGEAAHVLGKALAASGNEIRAQEKLEDVEMLRQRWQVEVAEQRAAKEATPESQELAEQLRQEANRYELDIYDRRAQRYPGDLELKFQLGLRLKRAANYRQAAALFEQAQELESRRSGATFELAECHQRLKKYASSLELYQQAAEEAEQPSQQPLRLLAWYRAAVLATGLGNAVAAQELFVQILDIDPAYRDARPRLDKLRQMGHNG